MQLVTRSIQLLAPRKSNSLQIKKMYTPRQDKSAGHDDMVTMTMMMVEESRELSKYPRWG